MRANSAFLPAAPVNPATLSTGADGFLYDPSVLASMYQDTVGTPVTAAGQSIAVILDQWIANTLGSNSVTNGTNPTTTTGWTGVSATLSAPSSTLKVANSGSAAGYAYQAQTTVVGSTYRVQLDSVASAQGCTLQIGTASNGSSLANVNVPAGSTGFFVLFIATTTTTYLRLVNTGTASGNFSTWNNLSCKSMAGRHLIQQASASRPVFQQDANGKNYLQFSSTQWIAGGFSFTAQAPCYLAVCSQREDGGTGTGPILGAFKSSSAYMGVVNSSSSRTSGIARDATLGSTGATIPVAAYPNGFKAAIDSLLLVGSNDVCTARRAIVVASNSWTSGTQQTLCAPGLATGPSGIAASGNACNIYAAVGMARDPGSNRPGIRAWLSNKALAD